MAQAGRHPKSSVGQPLKPGKAERPAVPGRVVQFLLDPEQLVVLRGAVGPGRRTGLDLAAVRRHREVRDGGVLGLAGAVAHHAGETAAVREVDGIQGLGQRADLVHLDEQRSSPTSR